MNAQRNHSAISRSDDAPDDGLTPSQIDAVNDAMDEPSYVSEWLGTLSEAGLCRLGGIIKDLPQHHPLYESLSNFCMEAVL